MLYGLAFTALLPVLLVLWAAGAQRQVTLPVPGPPALGVLLVALGAVLLAAGIASILRYGEGLPMNAFPPARFVTGGAYRIVRHPIYVGFALLCFGAALAARSAAGFWLVAPAAALGCAALVLGYERLDLERRFGRVPYRPWLSLPGSDDRAPSPSERIAVCVLALLPWLAVYGSLAALGPSPCALEAYLSFERGWPVLEWTEAFYGTTYVFVALAPFLAKRSRDLRDFAVDFLTATALAALVWVVVPVAAVPKPFEPRGPLGQLLLVERTQDVASNALPSFHVAAALLAARAFASRWPKGRAVWFGLAGAIGVSCVTTGMHAVLDVLAGAALALAVCRRGSLWESWRRGAERLANSWRQWRIGPVRVLPHAAYAGACGLIAVAGVGALLGSAALPAAIVLAVAGIVGASLGAQLIEGSAASSRPYGYFGGVAGGLLAAAAGSAVFGWSGWSLVAAFTVVVPWVVAVGRLRCLVQGCCHGGPAPSALGIRYTHPMSRVCRLSQLSGVSVHPTQLYSILWNIAVGLLLLRLWLAAAPLALVIGVYFVLAGLGRFVEEACRGEPQTPAAGRLRLYQWLAAASVAGGAAVTTCSVGWASGMFRPGFTGIVAGLAFGLFAAVAYGVDFPESQARFARLA